MLFLLQQIPPPPSHVWGTVPYAQLGVWGPRMRACGQLSSFIVPYTGPYKQEECPSLFSVNTRRYYDSSEPLPLLSSFRVWRKYTSKHTTSKAQPPSPPWGYEPCSRKAKFMLTVTLAYCLLTGHMLSPLILECPIIYQLLLSASYRWGPELHVRLRTWIWSHSPCSSLRALLRRAARVPEHRGWEGRQGSRRELWKGTV